MNGFATSQGFRLITMAGDPFAWAPDHFGQVAALPTSEIYVAADLQPRDPATGLRRHLLLSTASRLHTASTDTPPNACHRSRLMKGWTTERRIGERGRFLGASSYTVGTLLVENGDGELTEWLDMDWSDAIIELRVGGRTLLATGEAFPYMFFEPYFRGLGEDIRSAGDSLFEVVVIGRKKLLDQEVVQALYGGLGGALSTPVGESASGLKEIDPEDVSASGVTVQWLGTIDALPAPGNESALLVVWVGGFAATAYGLKLKNDGLVYACSGAGEAATGYAPPLGVRLYLSLSLAPATDLSATLWAATEGGPAERAATIAVAEPVLDPTGTPEIGTLLGLGGASLTTAEARIWRRALTDDESAAGDGPFLRADDEPDLIDLWKFEDAEGGIVRSQFGAAGVDLVLSGGASFVASLEGDDPTSFEGGPSGQTKPAGWGRAANVRLVNVDSPRHVRQWSRDESDDVERLYLGGAPLAPTEALTSTAGGQIVFAATGKTITFSGPLNARRFVAGQADPVREGQRIEILGSASNNATKRIAAGGVSADGLVVTVEETLVNETAGAGVTVRTLPADAQYTYDLSRSTITTPADLAGDVTADVVLWLSEGGTASASEVFEEVLGQSVDTRSLIWNPEVGIWLAPGSSLTRKDVLDRIAQSVCGWWVEDRQGGFKLGTWRLPSGTPKARVDASRIFTITSPPTITPFSRFDVEYAPNWTVQERSSLAGSVPTSRRDRVGKPFKVYPRSAPKALRDRYPLAKARREPFTTYLVRDADAERFADLAQPLYMEKRRWFEAEVSGLGLLSIDIDDCIEIKHPDPNLKIPDWTLVRLIAMEENSANDFVGVEAFR